MTTQSDTDAVGHDSGAFGSAGSMVAGAAALQAARQLGERIVDFAARHTGTAIESCRLETEAVDCDGQRIALKELRVQAAAAGVELSARSTTDGRRRSVAFNAHWFRVAVNPQDGEILILRSVHSADAGTVLNPMQCRGQIEGGVAQALGATLFEYLRVDESGTVTTPSLRTYHLPTFADVPRTEVHLVETTDAAGPLGAKSMSESPFNPVGPALANAVRDATGIRFTELPLARDAIWLEMTRAGHS